MKKQFEHFLLSVLLGTSVLLALTFWLNIKFGFNCLSATHWATLASLQASQTPINKDFYLSIGVAIFVFIVGLNIIYRPRFRKIPKKVMPIASPAVNPAPVPNIPDTQSVPQPTEPVIQKSETPVEKPPVNTIKNEIGLIRPPKLNLPRNMAQIAAQQHQVQTDKINSEQQTEQNNIEIAKIFTDNNYLVKKNAAISGLKTNLFAIGNNEQLWIGAVNCDIKLMQSAINQLNSVFTETLEDITIHINAFIIDTFGKYSTTDGINVFHNIQELSDFISAHPGDTIEDFDRENFEAYSEYIDTVITMLYKSQ